MDGADTCLPWRRRRPTVMRPGSHSHGTGRAAEEAGWSGNTRTARSGRAQNRQHSADPTGADPIEPDLRDGSAPRLPTVGAFDRDIITDLDGTIEYVNPAFERMSGYGRRLARGEPWSGRFSNRRADGGLYEIEATISPISGSDGGVAGYIGVQLDVTDLLAARSSLATAFRERAAVTAALSWRRAGRGRSPMPRSATARACSA